MWNGKKKAVTFSYDDGVTQDIRLIEIFNRYGLRATFNLNSGLLGGKNALIRGGVQVRHDKVRAEDVRAVYDGHEVAAHTLTHPALCTLPNEEVVRQVEEDRQALSALAGYEVVGMQRDLIAFAPTVYHLDMDKMLALGEEFLASATDIPQLFYIWGHSYEFDAWDFWEAFEAFCRRIGGHEDIFYGTNREVLLF